MKWDNICPVCLKYFELNDDITCEKDTLYHVQCLNKKEEDAEEEYKNKLKEAIINFDKMEEFVWINIDLETLTCYVNEIKESNYFITFTDANGEFGYFYTHKEILDELPDILETNRQEGNYLYITSVIKNRKFVKLLNGKRFLDL